MSYSGTHKLLSPLPSPPSPTDVNTFDNKAQAFIDAIRCEHWTGKNWVCLYCKTKTNLSMYKQQRLKSCYNCGSSEGEIK